MLDSLKKMRNELIKIERQLGDDNISAEKKEYLLKERERLRMTNFDIRLTEQMATVEYQAKINELDERKRNR